MILLSDRCGGVMTMEDLESHHADWCGTILASSAVTRSTKSTQWARDLCSHRPRDPRTISCFIHLDPDGVASIHLQVEAMKLAFADLHKHVADSAHMNLSSQELLSPIYLKERATLIDPNSAGSFDYGTPGPGGTVYLTAADEKGRMISLIQSNYMGFGSGIVVPGTGISLQNRGNGFRSFPGHVNSVGPRKRPLHTIIPSFAMKEGRPEMSFGVMGGPMQPQGHVQMAIRVLMLGQSPQEASDAPRWQVMGDGALWLEETTPEDVVTGLRSLGHRAMVAPGYANQAFGGAQLIRRRNGYYEAGSDHRKDGCAVGF